jgi:hypothetical protein
MRQHFAAIEQRDQLRIDGAEMVDPDRSRPGVRDGVQIRARSTL